MKYILCFLPALEIVIIDNMRQTAKIQDLIINWYPPFICWYVIIMIMPYRELYTDIMRPNVEIVRMVCYCNELRCLLNQFHCDFVCLDIRLYLPVVSSIFLKKLNHIKSYKSSFLILHLFKFNVLSINDRNIQISVWHTLLRFI